jgi:hypothetical protein
MNSQVLQQPRVTLALQDHSRLYRPGEVLAGQFSLEGVDAAEVRAIELSVLWYTHGKGDEDMSVHFFERIEPDDDVIDYRQPRRFSTVLPNSPLSYLGLIVKIAWCVRVRVFLVRGRELNLDVPFQLGNVPAPKLATPAAEAAE